VSTEETPPPSCVSSEGGGVSLVVTLQQSKHPSVLYFERGKGCHGFANPRGYPGMGSLGMGPGLT